MIELEQQRRQISEDRAKLEELRSKCKIREETYKVEIEKLRQKLNTIRFKFEQQQTHRQNSQDVQRLKEENILLRSQVQYQKQQLQQSFQTTNLLQTSRENSAKKRAQSSRASQEKLIDTISCSDSKISNDSQGKKIIASDMELVKVAQHKLKKENRSLKKRVDVMQTQMREIYDILVEEKAGSPILIYPNSSRDTNPQIMENQYLDQQQAQTSRDNQASIRANLTSIRKTDSLSSRKPDIARQQQIGSAGKVLNQIQIGGEEQQEVNQSPSSETTFPYSPVKPSDFLLLQEKIESTKDSFLSKIKTVFQKYSEQNEVFEKNNHKIKEISEQLLQHKHSDNLRANSHQKKDGDPDFILEKKPEKVSKESDDSSSISSSSFSSSSSSISLTVLESMIPSANFQQQLPVSQVERSFQKVISPDISEQVKINSFLESKQVQEKPSIQSDDGYYQKQQNYVKPTPVIDQDNFERDFQKVNIPIKKNENSSSRNNNLSKRKQVEKLEEQYDQFKQNEQNKVMPPKCWNQQEKVTVSREIDTKGIQRSNEVGQRQGNEYRSIKEQYESLLASNTPDISTNNYINSNSISSFYHPDQGQGYSDLSGRRYDHLHQFQVPKHYPNQIGANPNLVSGNSSRATTNYTNLGIGSNNPSGLFTSNNVSKNEIINKLGTNSSRQFEGVQQMKHFDIELAGQSAKTSPLRGTVTAGVGRRDGDFSGSQSLHFAPLQKKEGSMTSRTYEQKLDHLSKTNKILTPLASPSQQLQPSAQGDKITDEYIRQIIQQYKTPKKSSIPSNQPQTTTAAAGLLNTQKKSFTNQIPTSIANQYIPEKKESPASKVASISQQPSRLQTSRLLEKDNSLNNPFMASQPLSSRTSHSPSRFTKIQIPQIGQRISVSPTQATQGGIGTNTLFQGSNFQPLGPSSSSNSKEANPYNCYFGNNNNTNVTPYSSNNFLSTGGNNNIFASAQSSNLSTAIINPTYNSNINMNTNSNLISNSGANGFINGSNINNCQQNNTNLYNKITTFHSNSSPMNRKIAPISPPISTVSIGQSRESQTLNHKRQQSCGGPNGINKYNLKLNLTSLIAPKTTSNYQTDRQQSDRTAYSRLLPKAAMIVSTNISPKYSPLSSQSALAQRFPRK